MLVAAALTSVPYQQFQRVISTKLTLMLVPTVVPALEFALQKQSTKHKFEESSTNKNTPLPRPRQGGVFAPSFTLDAIDKWNKAREQGNNGLLSTQQR